MELSSVGMASTLDETTEVPTFRPSWEEFKDFNSYINYIETQGAHKVGLAKIIPPPEWIVRSEGYDNLDVTIPMPISQKMTGTQGLYQQSNTRLHKLHIREFEILSNSDKYRTPAFAGYDNLEDKYWKFLTYNQPIYGADVPASLFDKDQEVWNFQRLETILDNLADTEDSYEIMGITSPYLYYGMWCTSQAWSLEDMDLYNVNYLHYGSPRTWYVVPPEHGRRFEKLAAGLFPNVAQNCDAFLRHKTLIIAPKILKQYSIPVHKVVQESGEIIVSFPYAYRSGFNHGFNCSEAINFATERWIEYGKRCLLCDCSKELVRFKMDIFVRNYQPELYEKWTLGQDRERHPEAQYEDVLHPQLVRQMNLHLGLEPGMSDVKPVISDIGSLGQPQGHRVPDTTQILLDAAQLAQEQERQSLAGGSQEGGSSAQTLALPGAREILESLTQQELLELRQQHLHQAMTPATALAAAAKDPTTADVVKVFKQVHTKVMQPQMDLYREAQSKGLVGAEPLSRKRSLDMSQDEAYKQLRALEESVLPTDDGTYKCATCGVEYNTSEELRSHLRTHSREKPYWCGYCGKVFSQEQSLKVHLRIHTGEKPYKCDICERQFTQMSSLNRHFRVHTGERPYKCETCGKDFAQPGTLRDHSMTHTGQKPFKCPVCGKGFIQSTAMKTHERTHSGERPFKCKQCHKAFRQSSLLNIHEKTHLSEKPYVCDICNRGFTTKSFMNIHRKSHMNHSGVATSSTVTSFDHRGGSTSSHSTNLSAIDTNKYLQSPAALVSGIEESLAAVIKQERDSTSAEAAALSVAATALNDLQHHISHRDETSSMVTGRDAIHITPRDQLLRASASNLSQRGDPLGQLRVSTGGLNPRDDLGQLRASSSSMNHREEVDLTPSSNSSLLSPTKLPPASIFKQSSLSTQNMDTLLTADQVIDQALMARSEQAVLDRAMFDRSALERTAAITLQRAAMHAAQTEHTSPTGSMHEIHETSPLHDRVSAAGPFNLHQGSQDTASDMLQQSPQQSAMHDRGKFMNPGAGLNDHNDVDHQSNQIAQQDPSQHPQSMMSDVPTMPHGMHDKTALQYAIAALRDYPDMFQEKVAGAAGHNTATSMAQQMDTAASPPTSNSQPEPGQLSMATSNDPLLESQRINNQIGLSLRDTSALQQVLRDSQTSQPTNQTPLVGRTVTMDLSPEEEAQILQKRSALAQAVSALYTDNMNQQDRTGMLPENLSIQPSDNLTISGGAASQLSPQDAVASPPLNDGASGAETGANDNHHGPGGGGAGSTSGGVSALQLQQLQQVSVLHQVSALHQAANFQQTLLQQAMSLQQAAMQEAATIQRPGSPQTTHQQ